MDAVAALTKAMQLYDALAARRPSIQETESHFDGKQPLKFATREWRALHEGRYEGFSDNWCGVVGAAPAQRLIVDGFRLGDDTDPLSADEQVLWRDWETNDGPAQSAQGFQTSTVSKRSFALVWGDENDEPTLSWEHPSQVIVEHDVERPRVRRFALKTWTDDDLEFLTLYTPNEVWKWSRKTYERRNADGTSDSGLYLPASLGFGGGWAPRQGNSDATWPLRNPLGVVPVVEFPNRPRLGVGPLSDISGTIAMQNAVNLLWAYLFVAADYASMPARVVMGQAPPKMPILDEDGQVVGEQPVDHEALKQGRLLWLTGQSTTIGQWDPASLDVFTSTINVAVKHIAAQTSTPIYLIHGELGNVNGETLTALDAPLVAKVAVAQGPHASALREVFRLFALVRSNTKIAEAARSGHVRWRNPASASDIQVSDAAIKARSAGMPFQSVLEDIYGYSPSRVERIMQMVRAEGEDPYLVREEQKAQQAGA